MLRVHACCEHDCYKLCAVAVHKVTAIIFDQPLVLHGLLCLELVMSGVGYLVTWQYIIAL